MNTVAEAVTQRIRAQVEAHGIVVWFDPEQRFRGLIEHIALPNCTICRYTDSFFALRAEIDHLLDDDNPPRLVVYVPRAEADTQHALLELTCAGTTMAPDASGACCTNLVVIAREVLTGRVGQDVLHQWLSQLSVPPPAGLALEALDSQAASYTTPRVGILTEIFKTGDDAAIVLAFVSHDEHDSLIMQRHMVDELATVVAGVTGCDLDPAQTPSLLREQLALWIIQTDFIASVHEPPAALQAITAATQPHHRANSQHIAQQWRKQQGSYHAQSERIAALLQITAHPLTIAQARDCWTFAAIDRMLQTAIEPHIVEEPDLLAVAAERLLGPWAHSDHMIMVRWRIIQTAGMLCQIALTILQALRGPRPAITELVRRYCDDTAPWYQLDTLQRQLEHDALWQVAQPKPQTTHTLIVQARHHYREASGTLAETFTRSLRTAEFAIAGVLRQRDIFAHAVQPALHAGKTAYLLIDALRYEMAVDLISGFEPLFTAQIAPAIGTPPTITPIGMAALLPGADQATLEVTKTGLGLRIGASILADRKGRMAWLKQQHLPTIAGRDAKIAEMTLADLLADEQAQSKLAKADLIVVTAQEIDELGEMDNTNIRAAMDSMLAHLHQGCRVLAQAGVTAIIIAADHGYLFGTEVGQDMTVAPPGGETLALHRRAWVGRGGALGAAFLRVPLATFGLGTDLELAAPWGLAMFSAPGGNRAYFHGGLSPQEVIVPVVTVQVQQQAPSATDEWIWQLTLNSENLTTRMLMATISAMKSRLFGARPPERVRIELRAGTRSIGQVMPDEGEMRKVDVIELPSVDTTASSLTKMVAIEVTADAPPVDPLVLVLLDAATGRELASTPLTWKIAL